MRQRLIARVFNKKRNKTIQIQFVELKMDNDERAIDMTSNIIPGITVCLQTAWRTYMSYYRGSRNAWIYVARNDRGGDLRLNRPLRVPKELWPAVEDLIIRFNKEGTHNTVYKDDVIINVDKDVTMVGAYVSACKEDWQFQC